MKRKPIVVRIVVDRRAAGVIMAAVAVGALAMRLSSETLTLTTTYPAPVGVYNQIVTTGNSGTVPADTTLALNSGNVILTGGANINGKVGVGTNAPQAKLDVGGTIRIGSLPNDPTLGPDGTIYYNTAMRQARMTAGGAWTNLGGIGQGGFCGYASVPGLDPVYDNPCQGTDISKGNCPAGFSLVQIGVGSTCIKN